MVLKKFRTSCRLRKLNLQSKPVSTMIQISIKWEFRFTHFLVSVSNIALIPGHFKVVDLLLYHREEQQLLDDLQKFSPDFLMLAWCDSRDSDVTQLLRREGFFSYMMLRHDLQILTGNPKARPNELQMKLVQEIGKGSCQSRKKYGIFHIFHGG